MAEKILRTGQERRLLWRRLPGADGEFVVNNGVTRATRIAKLLPGVPVRVEVIDDLPIPWDRSRP